MAQATVNRRERARRRRGGPRVVRVRVPRAFRQLRARRRPPARAAPASGDLEVLHLLAAATNGLQLANLFQQQLHFVRRVQLARGHVARRRRLHVTRARLYRAPPPRSLMRHAHTDTLHANSATHNTLPSTALHIPLSLSTDVIDIDSSFSLRRTHNTRRGFYDIKVDT